jgi:membrane protease YdiL (CAAX protease family)
MLTVVAFCSYVSGALLVQLVHHAIYGGLLKVPGRAFWGHPTVGALPYFLLTPIFEELIVRAYLMTEIIELTGSSLLAVVVSVLLQASYHLYYGWYGAVCLGFSFLILALYYAKYRRALPVMFAHELYDLIVLARIW